jgi:carbonic anhydrase
MRRSKLRCVGCGSCASESARPTCNLISKNCLGIPRRYFIALGGANLALCLQPESSIASSSSALAPSPPPQAETTASTSPSTLDYGPPSGPSTWNGTCASGSRQSPIDIPLAHTNDIAARNSTPSSALASTPPIRSKYPRLARVSCRNNAHGSPELLFPPGIRFEFGSRSFTLQSLHFHVPSEHAFDGRHSPGEAHFVHVDDDSGETVVLAVLLRIGAANTVVQTALDLAPSVPGASSLTLKAVNLRSMLPPRLTARGSWRYAYYEGSLTTPPCAEAVRWIVLLDPVEVSATQVLDLMAFAGKERHTWATNARPLQRLNGRDIRYFT